MLFSVVNEKGLADYNSAPFRVCFRGRERIAGVEYVSRQDGETRRAEGDIVVLCAGTIETTKLLMASAAAPWWPDGVGNHSGHLGRHLKAHQLLVSRGQLPSNPRKAQQELDFPTLCSRHFDTPEEQRMGKLFFVRSGLPRIAIENSIIAGKAIKEIEADISGPAMVGFDGFLERFSLPENRIALAKGVTDNGLPRTTVNYKQSDEEIAAAERALALLESILVTMGARSPSLTKLVPRIDHAISTCRMSRSESDGVTDENLRVHGTDNLFICSNAVMPTGGAVNPTLTLVAF